MTDVNREVQASKYRWYILGVAMLAFIAFAYSFQVAPPLIPPIIKEFNINNAQAGLLMSIIPIPGIILAIPIILLMNRYKLKPIVTTALLIVSLGSIITGTADSYIIIIAGRFMVGIGGAIIMTAAPSIIYQWFPKQELGKAMGIFSTNMPIAMIVALPTASEFSQTMGWRYLFYLGAGIGIISAIIIVATMREAPLGKEKETMNLRGAFSLFEIWKVGIIWLIFQASMLSFITWAPTILRNHRGSSSLQASLMTSLISWTALVMVPLYGYLSDKMGKKRIFIILGSLLMSLSFVAISLTSDLALFTSILALGIFSAMIPPIIQVLPSEILNPSMVKVGFGVMNMIGNLGVVLAPPIVGYIVDITNSYLYTVTTLSIIAFLGVIFGLILKTK